MNIKERVEQVKTELNPYEHQNATVYTGFMREMIAELDRLWRIEECARELVKNGTNGGLDKAICRASDAMELTAALAAEVK